MNHTYFILLKLTLLPVLVPGGGGGCTTILSSVILCYDGLSKSLSHNVFYLLARRG